MVVGIFLLEGVILSETAVGGKPVRVSNLVVAK